VRLRTSGENLLDLLFMTLSSQKLEPPLKPGRFKIIYSLISQYCYNKNNKRGI
jgi:hypothetical protein